MTEPRDALTALYASRWAPMVRLAHLLTGSNVVAQDVVQDAFLKIGSRVEDLDNAGAYLRTTVVNECRQWYRRREVEARHVRAEQPGVALPPELDETWAALEQVSERQRMVLVLRYYEDLTIEQTAEVLGCRPGTVKALAHRGLKTLKELLDDAS